MRVRLKADGRIVEILADGSERPLAAERSLAAAPLVAAGASSAADRVAEPERHAADPSDKEDVARYSRRLRGRAKLTQAEFAARIGVLIETVRNWEQGKRAPRGPARALLKVIEAAPEIVFAALAENPPNRIGGAG